MSDDLPWSDTAVLNAHVSAQGRARSSGGDSGTGEKGMLVCVELSLQPIAMHLSELPYSPSPGNVPIPLLNFFQKVC